MPCPSTDYRYSNSQSYKDTQEYSCLIIVRRKAIEDAICKLCVGIESDIHAVNFDDQGNGIYRMQNGEDWIYPAVGFGGQGEKLSE